MIRQENKQDYCGTENGSHASQFPSHRSQFKKSEHIVSKKLIDELFSGRNSHSKAAFPLRIVYMLQPLAGDDSVKAQVLISVSKRHFKHAVDRNRVKRQIREAYRTNKHLFLDSIPAGQRLSLAFVWLSDELVPSYVVAKKVKKLLKAVLQDIQSTPENHNGLDS